jgi:hypothetical protein
LSNGTVYLKYSPSGSLQGQQGYQGDAGSQGPQGTNPGPQGTQGPGAVHQLVVLGADFTTNTTTSGGLKNITGLGFAIGNSEQWQFEWLIQMGNAAATGCKIGITQSVTTAPALRGVIFGVSNATTFRNDVLTVTNVAAGNTYIAAAITTGFVRISGIISASASGACTVYPAVYAGNTAATVTAYANSYLIAHHI